MNSPSDRLRGNLPREIPPEQNVAVIQALAIALADVSEVMCNLDASLSVLAKIEFVKAKEARILTVEETEELSRTLDGEEDSDESGEPTA